MTDLIKNIHWLEGERQTLQRELSDIKQELIKLHNVRRCAQRVCDIDTALLDDYDHELLARLEDSLEPFQGVL